MIRREIANGIYLTQVAGNYKRSRLSVYMASPLRRETLSETAILPFIMERGTTKLPDMTLLRRRQNALYGANLSTNYSSVGFSRVVEGYVEGVDGSFIQDGADVAAQRTDLLLDVLFDPYVENGAFRGDWIDIEREKLREAIRSIINEKRDYCAKLLSEAFYDDERGLPVDGFEEDLDLIGGERTYQVYKDTVAQSGLEVIYVGSDYEGLEQALVERLQVAGTNPAGIKPLTAIPKRDELVIVQEMDVEQDKLAMAFTCGRVLNRQEMVVLRVANALLGAAPTSRLHQNVREKQSLCYYVSAQPSYKSGGGMVIESGIEHQNVARTKEAILHEMRTLAKDGPTQQELVQIKLLFQNILQGVSDSSAALSGYIYSNIVRYEDAMTAEQELAMIEQVTAEEVMAILSDMNLNASCLISEKEGLA